MEGAATVRAGRRGRRLAAALPLLALALACAGPAGPGAASAPTAAGASLDRCDSDTAGRLRFLEQRLAAERTHGRVWQAGWTGAYGFGVLLQGARAGLEDDAGERADLIVSAVKATIGTARLLLSPTPARHGAEAARAIAPTDADACARRLEVAESALEQSAERARSRFSWKSHLANVVLNVGGAVIVAVGFDEPEGWASGVLGLLVGEAQIWSHPWRADEAWEEYERRFPASGLPPEPRTTWRVGPTGVELRF